MRPEYDVIGPWSEVKLDILREYAAPYSRIVASNGFYHSYIDASLPAVLTYRERLAK